MAAQLTMTDRARDLRAQVRTFIDEEVIPLEPILGSHWLGRATPESTQAMEGLRESARRQGIFALGHPTELGGGGLTFGEYAYINEVIGRSLHGIHALGTLTLQDTIMFNKYASQEQRERWLEPLARGEILMSVGLTEPEVAGSDPTLIESTARLENGEWVINAHKWFTSLARHAAFTTVWVKTDPDGPRHKQFSAIIVPTDAPGYEVVRVIPTLTGTGGEHAEIRLTEVRVPESALLGERGEGFKLAQTRLAPGRIFHCMRWLGQSQRAFELMCDYAKTRYAHGSYLSEKGEIQRYIAESAAEIQASRLMTLAAAQAIDEGKPARAEISMIKFFGARTLHNVIDRALQVHGSLGLTSDTPLEFMYREARYARIYDGPDEVHRMVVARELLRDPYASAPWS
ncbi:acyl-CoA dehydrogenase family protein [Nocardia jiangxiensis]|uniref:acyl-CoA dehydrogenase family protein n=1 Tax=Nocardia jiangxiensis TaxID=282685 RepID=UPI00030AFA3A|nr:acyl-CoA dehydrogenase family protein [Nocardia jiangxiensis]